MKSLIITSKMADGCKNPFAAINSSDSPGVEWCVWSGVVICEDHYGERPVFSRRTSHISLSDKDGE